MGITMAVEDTVLQLLTLAHAAALAHAVAKAKTIASDKVLGVGEYRA